MVLGFISMGSVRSDRSLRVVVRWLCLGSGGGAFREFRGRRLESSFCHVVYVPRRHTLGNFIELSLLVVFLLSLSLLLLLSVGLIEMLLSASSVA